MKTPGKDIVSILYMCVTYASLVLGSNDVKCDLPILKLKGANMPTLTFKVPRSCTGYSHVFITQSSFDYVNIDAFDDISKPKTEFMFVANKGLNRSLTNFGADFRGTGIIAYDVSANRIELGSDLAFHEHSKRIFMNNNNLTDLPSGLFQKLGELKFLKLNQNQLTSLNLHIFHDLVKLEKLYINRNRLTYLDSHIFQGLVELKLLHMQANLLTCLDSDTFHNLKYLKELDLSRNKIKYLMSETFKELLKLEVLNLASNELITIPADQFLFWSDITREMRPVIDVQNNPLTNLPRCLASLDTFKYNKTPSLNITGVSDPPGTAAMNICQNADEHIYITKTCYKSKSSTPQEHSPTTDYKLTTNKHESTTRPNEKKPKSYDWMYIFFSVLFFLLLPVLGALIWWIRKSVIDEDAAVTHLEFEDDSAQTKHSEILEMKELNTRKAEMTQEYHEELRTTQVQHYAATKLNDHEIRNQRGKSPVRKLATRRKRPTKPRVHNLVAALLDKSPLKSVPPATHLSKTAKSRPGKVKSSKPSKIKRGSQMPNTSVQPPTSQHRSPKRLSRTVKYSGTKPNKRIRKSATWLQGAPVPPSSNKSSNMKVVESFQTV